MSEVDLQLQVYNPENKYKKPDDGFTICTTGALVGASVSAIVYSSIVTSGEVTAGIASSGISITGNIIALGVEYIGGTLAGNSVRQLARTSSAVAGPTISNSSRVAAAGISLIAGTASAISTSVVLYGSKCAVQYISNCIDSYKEKLAEKIQAPVPIEMIISEDLDIMLIENYHENINLVENSISDL